jgi:hypothetical protein
VVDVRAEDGVETVTDVLEGDLQVVDLGLE